MPFLIKHLTFSIYFLFVLYTEPPGPPSDLKVIDSTKTSITLGWTKPVYDGGSLVTGYVVEMRPKGVKKSPEEGWTRCNVAAQLVVTQFTASSLDEKQEYEFKVSAQNQVGIGRPAELKEAIFPKEILGMRTFGLFFPLQYNDMYIWRYV